MLFIFEDNSTNYGDYQNNVVSIEAAWVGHVSGEIDAKTNSSSIRVHTNLMSNDVYCGPHYSAFEGQVTLIYTHNTYHK